MIVEATEEGPPTIVSNEVFSARSSLPLVLQPTGAFVQSIPLEVPPGRNGLTPEISLSYNSQQLKDGIVGYGWSLSLPYIERLNKTGVNRLYEDDFFTTSMGGELATTSANGDYRLRFDDGSFLSFVFFGNSWTAYDKKGTKYTFGATTTAQLYATTTPADIYRWMLEEVRDTNDNYITYEYERDADTNQIYPKEIRYTGHGTTDGIFEIAITREARTDPIISYESGFRVETHDRIGTISASVNGSWVRKYELDYASGVNGARSLLTSVQQIGRDESSTELTMPAQTFGYSSSSPGFASRTSPRVYNAARVVGDVDGDGLLDMAIFDLDGANTKRRISWNNFPESFGETTATISTEYWAYPGDANEIYRPAERGVRFIDANGDGRADLLRSVSNAGVHTRTYFENSGGSWIAGAMATSSIPTFGFRSGGGNDYSAGIFGNINGDGLVDYVLSLNNCGGSCDPNGSYLNQGTTTGWQRIIGAYEPVAFIGASTQSSSMLVDINGDGLDDWVQSGSADTKFHLNTGTDWASTTQALEWRIATSTLTADGYDRGIRFYDFNGDGLTDYIRSYGMPTCSPVPSSRDCPEIGSWNYVYLNTGSGWATTTLTVPTNIFAAVYGSGGHWYGDIAYDEPIDWNSDGIPDYREVTSTTTRPDLLVRLNHPEGGSTDVSYEYSSQTGLNPELAFPQLIVKSITHDDGFGNKETSSYTYRDGKMYLTGDYRDRRFAGFGEIIKQTALGFVKTFFHQGETASSTAGELIDEFALIGRAYREDVLSNASSTLQRTFFRWDALDIQTSTSSSNSHALDLESSSSQYAAISDGSQTGLDITGDLSIGAWINLESFAYEQQQHIIAKRRHTDNQRSYNLYIYQNAGSPILRFDTTTNGLTAGCAVWVSWSPSTATWYHVAVTKSGTSLKFYVNGTQQGSTQTCSSATIHNGTAPFEIGAYSNEGTYFDGIIDDVRIWSRELSSTEVSNLHATPGSFANGANLQGSWQFNNSYADGSGNANSLTAYGSPVFTTTVPYTGAYANDANQWFTALTQKIDEAWEEEGTHKARATEYLYSTSTGALLRMVERGEASGSTGTFTDVGADSRFTEHTYATSSRNLVVMTGTTVKNHASTTVALTNYYYDDQPFGSTTKGNLTKEERWISGSTYASSTKSYNTFGMVATSTDPRGYKTEFLYDTVRLYVATTTTALGHVTGTTFDYAAGKQKGVIDPKGQRRAFTFDPVGRVTEEKQSDIAAPSTLVSSRTYTYTDTFPRTVFSRTYFTSSTSSDAYTYFDGLSRKIQERSQVAGDNTFAVRDFSYNSAGLPARESLPYFASSSARTAATSTGALFTSLLYDALGRATSSATVVGTTTYARFPWEMRSVDPNGNQKRFTYDAYQNLASVIEYIGPTPYTTSYAYDALQNLTKITDALGSVRNFTFDGLSRRTSAEDLHDTADSTFGTWLYAYDLAGNLASSTDPKSQNVVYGYDALNRLSSEDFLSTAGTEITYTYDTCPYGIGHMCVASTTDVRTTYSYNVLGLSDEERSIINGIGYASTTFGYDRQGNSTSVTYPDGREVFYGYDLGGRIGVIQSKAAGGAFSHILTRADYSPMSQTMLRSYGNGLSSPFAYDANKLYRLTRIGSTGAVQDIAYEYDAVGNIVGITDLSNTAAEKTLVFEYDDLYRLTLASTTAASSTPFREAYGYNILGNLLYKRFEDSPASPANPYALDLEKSSNQFVSIGDGSQTGLDFSNDLTFSMWINLESFATNELIPLIVKRNGTGNQRSYSWYLFDIAGSKTMNFDYSSSGANGTDELVSWAPSLSTWYHIALVKDDDAVMFYVNGTQQGATQTGSFAGIYNSSSPFEVGSWTNEGSAIGYVDGIVDDVRTWSRALSSTEIADLYATPGSFANGASLQGSWQFNNSYTDGSGNANTLTAYGSPVFTTTVPYTGDSDSGGEGSYAYDEIDFANPHAPTGIWNGFATTSLVYDRNGNLTQYGTTTAYTWDWRNRMTAGGILAATTTYAYDHTEQRRAQRTPSKTFHYPNKYYSIEYQGTSTTTATSTSYIWHGDTLVAYIEQAIENGIATGSPTTYYVHPDHLGSTNVVTNGAGDVVQVLDYYPFGEQRIDTGAKDSERQYIGERYDAASGLNYLNARYYDSGRGQFLSQDVIFLLQGDSEALKQRSGSEAKPFLHDPQLLNSYSYGKGSPVVLSDRSGDTPGALLGMAALKALLWAGRGLTYVDYVNFDTVTSYPEGVELHEIDTAGNRFLQSLWLSGVTWGSSDLVQGGIDLGGVILNVKEEWCEGHSCQQVNADKNGAGKILDRIRSDRDASNGGFLPNQANGAVGGGNGVVSFDFYARQLLDIQSSVDSIRKSLDARIINRDEE